MELPEPAQGDYDSLFSRLASRRQEHVLRWWPELTASHRVELARQVEGIDIDLLEELYTQAESGEVPCPPALEETRPAAAVQLTDARQFGQEKEHAARRGRQALNAGQVAVVLVAGGQGTRLGHDGPKGTFPIGPVSGRTLFQIHAEKVLAVSRRSNVPLPLYVMTSPDNHATTRDFFADHDFFGLDAEGVIFFPQGVMPAMDRQTGRLLMADRHRIAASPNGHGGVVKALADGGHLADMRRRGIRYVFYYQVDNPLVKVADPAYLGYHVRTDAEMSLKVVRKLYPEERLGVVVEAGGRLQLIEYSDLPAEIARRRLPDGSLEIWAGSIAVHVFNVSFLERLAGDGWQLPYHRAVKQVPHLDVSGQLVRPAEPNAVKFEMFVFDALPLAQRALVVETDRREEFEPLKNADGENSPSSVRQAMSNLFARWLDGIEIQVPYRPDGAAAVPIEVSPLLALDAEELRERLPWRGPVIGPLLLDDRTELVRHQQGLSRQHAHREHDNRQRPPACKPAPVEPWRAELDVACQSNMRAAQPTAGQE